DLVEVAVHLEAQRARPPGVDALGPAVADLLDRRVVLPDHLAHLAVAGVAADRLLELPGGDVDAVQQQRAARPEGVGRQVVQADEGVDRLARAQHHHDRLRRHRADDVDAGQLLAYHRARPGRG